MLFKDWDDFAEIVSYWELEFDINKIIGYNDRHKISNCLKEMAKTHYNKNNNILFTAWLENKVEETRQMIEYYKVNQ
jgi:hypothetical protein